MSVEKGSCNSSVRPNPTPHAVLKTPAAKAKLLLREIRQATRETRKEIFSLDELKFFANRVNILYDMERLTDILNVQGFLLKKGPSSTSLLTSESLLLIL